MQLTRKSPPAYSDGVYQMAGKDRPNPIAISEKVFKGATGERSHRYRTVLLTFFGEWKNLGGGLRHPGSSFLLGQQVVEEILDAQRPGCPPEYENIPVPPDHPTYKAEFMPFLRSRYDMTTGYSPNVPREQLNEITPWIDGNLFYGTTKAWADALRSLSGGELACEDAKCLFPKENSIGLPMANPPPPRDHVLKSAKRFNSKCKGVGGNNNIFYSFCVEDLEIREAARIRSSLRSAFSGFASTTLKREFSPRRIPRGTTRKSSIERDNWS